MVVFSNQAQIDQSSKSNVATIHSDIRHCTGWLSDKFVFDNQLEQIAGKPGMEEAGNRLNRMVASKDIRGGVHSTKVQDFDTSEGKAQQFIDQGDSGARKKNHDRNKVKSSKRRKRRTAGGKKIAPQKSSLLPRERNNTSLDDFDFGSSSLSDLGSQCDGAGFDDSLDIFEDSDDDSCTSAFSEVSIEPLSKSEASMLFSLSCVETSHHDTSHPGLEDTDFSSSSYLPSVLCNSQSDDRSSTRLKNKQLSASSSSLMFTDSSLPSKAKGDSKNNNKITTDDDVCREFQENVSRSTPNLHGTVSSKVRGGDGKSRTVRRTSSKSETSEKKKDTCDDDDKNKTPANKEEESDLPLKESLHRSEPNDSSVQRRSSASLRTLHDVRRRYGSMRRHENSSSHVKAEASGTSDASSVSGPPRGVRRSDSDQHGVRKTDCKENLRGALGRCGRSRSCRSFHYEPEPLSGKDSDHNNPRKLYGREMLGKDSLLQFVSMQDKLQNPSRSLYERCDDDSPRETRSVLQSRSRSQSRSRPRSRATSQSGPRPRSRSTSQNVTPRSRSRSNSRTAPRSLSRSRSRSRLRSQSHSLSRSNSLSQSHSLSQSGSSSGSALENHSGSLGRSNSSLLERRSRSQSRDSRSRSCNAGSLLENRRRSQSRCRSDSLRESRSLHDRAAPCVSKGESKDSRKSQSLHSRLPIVDGTTTDTSTTVRDTSTNNKPNQPLSECKTPKMHNNSKPRTSLNLRRKLHRQDSFSSRSCRTIRSLDEKALTKNKKDDSSSTKPPSRRRASSVTRSENRSKMVEARRHRSSDTITRNSPLEKKTVGKKNQLRL